MGQDEVFNLSKALSNEEYNLYKTTYKILRNKFEKSERKIVLKNKDCCFENYLKMQNSGIFNQAELKDLEFYLFINEPLKQEEYITFLQNECNKNIEKYKLLTSALNQVGINVCLVLNGIDSGCAQIDVAIKNLEQRLKTKELDKTFKKDCVNLHNQVIEISEIFNDIKINTPIKLAKLTGHYENNNLKPYNLDEILKDINESAKCAVNCARQIDNINILKNNKTDFTNKNKTESILLDYKVEDEVSCLSKKSKKTFI
ncbi:MAG: hypothetical protein IJZ26_03445, partial [Clostridia bacterium]|nr:hypothetical protein [Clostridia bacterium]